MGSQVPSLALSAINAGVSSNSSCYAGYHHSQHMASCSLHTIQGKESCPAHPILHRNNAVDAGAAGAALGVATQYFANQIFTPCTRGGTRGGNKNTNNRIFGGQTLANGALGFAAGFAGAALVNSALGNPCG